MEAKKLIKIADLQEEHDKVKPLYEEKKRQTKEAELDQMFTSFENYFKNKTGFTIKKETSGKIEARYKTLAIILEKDEFNTKDDPSFSVIAKLHVDSNGIKSYWVKTFVVNAATPKLPSLSQLKDSEEDKLIRRLENDLNYYNKIVSGQLSYDFNYKIGSETQKINSENFNSFEELLETKFDF